MIEATVIEAGGDEQCLDVDVSTAGGLLLFGGTIYVQQQQGVRVQFHETCACIFYNSARARRGYYTIIPLLTCGN
jgi:hypothetical protein